MSYRYYFGNPFDFFLLEYKSIPSIRPMALLFIRPLPSSAPFRPQPGPLAAPVPCSQPQKLAG
jgi:hypothetical protein